MNPAGKVPVLDEDGWILPESAVIAEYLNERYPEPPLWPDDPGERAAGRLLIFRFDDFSKPYYALRRGEEGARGRFEEELGFLDAMLSGVPWLSGRSFGLADIAFLPWLLRARDLTRDPARAMAGARRLGRALLPAAVRRGRAAAGRGAVTVVYLHAFPLDERMWSTEAAAPPLYGLGRTMDDWADAVLEAYPGRIVLVGASMGGYAAMAAARRPPSASQAFCSWARGRRRTRPSATPSAPRRSRLRANAGPRACGRRCARRSSATRAIRTSSPVPARSCSTAPRRSS